MSMLSFTRPAVLAAAFGLASLTGFAAYAEGEAAAPAKGENYVKETYDSWEMRCVKTDSGNDPCQIYQLLKNGEGTSVAEISMFPLPEGSEAVAGATVMAPLETLLTAGLRYGIDDAEPKVYPFTFCATVGCMSRVGFTADEIEKFKSGGKGVMTIVPAVAPDKPVTLEVSLKGFTAAYEAVVENNKAVQDANAGN